jgi:hypothetical protein
MSEKHIQLSVDKIEIKSFSMTNEVLNLNKKDPFIVEFGFGVSIPDDKGRLSFNLDLVVDKEDSKGYVSRLAHLKTVSFFFVKDHAQFVTVTSDDIKQVDGSLVKVLMEVCLHQIRGIWAAKTENTPLDYVVIPLLNAQKLLEHSNQRK